VVWRRKWKIENRKSGRGRFNTEGAEEEHRVHREKEEI
jgi:hypothetical protein